MKVLDWLTELVRFDTTSRHSNLDLIKVIETWFHDHQLQSYLTYDERKEKANIFATLPARDGNLQGGIILSGHTDVVPVDGQAWRTPPFVATQIDDKIFGRGTSDMKGFIAVCLALLPEFKQKGLSKPVHFAFSYDEEVGCLGAPIMIKDFGARGGRADACIVGEPTEMRPVVAHKGIQVHRVKVKGLAAHSSLTHQGCNAIDHAAELITGLRKIADEMREQGPFDEHFDVPYSTLSTNLIRGGNAFNTIPSECEFIFEFRYLPQIQPDFVRTRLHELIDQNIKPKMQAEYPDAAIEVDCLAHAPSFEAAENAAILQQAFAITQAKDIAKVAYGTEAGLFQAAQIPTIVCGPGSITVAHRADEYVTIAQLDKCESFLRQLLR